MSIYQQKGSLVARAIEEFNKVSSKQEQSLDQGDIQNQNNESSSIRKGQNPQKRRSVLGRGLSSLMTSTAPVVDVNLNSNKNPNNEWLTQNNQSNISTNETTTSSSNKILQSSSENNSLIEIAIDQLKPNPEQPRREFSKAEINELANSIRRTGVIQPIIVRKIEKANKTSFLTEYQIVAGERRWRAAKEAGLIKIPAILKELSDRETLELGIIENVQRQDLNPIEEALAYQKLIAEFGTAQDELAKIIGKDRSSISNTLRLLGLPELIQNLIKERKLSAGHGRAILSLENEEEQISLARNLVENKLSVREAEKQVSEKKNAPKIKENTEISIIDNALEERLRKALGTKVKVKMSKDGKGEVKISFFSKAEFDSFLEKVETV